MPPVQFIQHWMNDCSFLKCILSASASHMTVESLVIFSGQLLITTHPCDLMDSFRWFFFPKRKFWKPRKKQKPNNLWVYISGGAPDVYWTSRIRFCQQESPGSLRSINCHWQTFFKWFRFFSDPSLEVFGQQWGCNHWVFWYSDILLRKVYWIMKYSNKIILIPFFFLPV